MLELEQRAVDLLLRTPVAMTMSGRSTLLTGLPTELVTMLSRSAESSFTDLVEIITQLSRLGPLVGGVRPVLAVLAAGQRTVPGTTLEKEIASTIISLERAYGRDDAVPPLAPTESAPDLSSQELLVFSVDHRLPFDFIDGAYRAAHAIARLEVPLGESVGYGTAWLCGRDLLMTNWHVLAGDRRVTIAELHDNARRAVAWFDYRSEGGAHVEMAISSLAWADEKLDCAILELPSGAAAGRTPLRSADKRAELMRGARLNILQHPRGGPIQFAIRSNYFAGDSENLDVIRYVTDTEKGSSGSPVCDDTWVVVALHARSAPIAPQLFADGTAHYVNEGVAFDRIRAAMPSELSLRIG